MPNYKMVDADILDGAMLETAKAIREKGGTEELIAWNKSTGYKEAIEAIKGGSGLNFTVVGGTTQPENPAENTVWVNTTIPINKWIASPTRPAAANHGDVWVQIKTAGELIDVLDENSLIIGIVGIEQYDTDKWVIVPGGIFVNNAWTEFTVDYPIFIPDGGAKSEFGSWTGSSGVVTNDGNVLSVHNTDMYGNGSDFLIYTTSKIDTSGFDTLELVFEVTGTSYFNYQTFGFAEAVKTNQKDQECVSSKGTEGTGAMVIGNTYEYYLDIKALDGEYYFVFFGYHLQANIKQIYLRKEQAQ